MNTIIALAIPHGLKNHVRLILTTLLCLLMSSVIFAQPKFSPEQLRLLKERNLISRVSESQTPTDVLPLSNESGQISNALGGQIDSTFNASVSEGVGYVNQTVVQPDGKIIAVGLFQRSGALRTGGIARFNADGSFDNSFTTGTGANALIYTVTLQSDGKILIGGNFTSFNGQSISRLARLNTDGSLDTTFLHGLNFSAQVNAVTVQPDGKILVGGAFFASEGNPLRGGIARLNSDGTIDSTFNNGSTTTGAPGTIYKIVYLADNKILIGGGFTTYNSQTAFKVARLNNDGSRDTSFNAVNSNGAVRELLVQPDGKILISGVFFTISNMPTDSIARLNEDGSLANTFETNHPSDLNQLTFGMALQPDGKIVVGVTDDTLFEDGQVLRFNADATIDNSFLTGNIGKSAIRNITSQADGKLLISGDFTIYNDQPHLHLARINSNGSVDAGFNPSISTTGTVYVIKQLTDGKILIGGDFEYVNGIRTGAIARLNLDGTLDNSFTLNNKLIGDVYAIEVQPDGKIIVGGNFEFEDEKFSAYNAIRLNSNGSFDINLNTEDEFIVLAYAVALQSDGKILISGRIYDIAQNFSIPLRRVLSNGDLDSSFTPPLLNRNATVQDILVQPDGKIIFGGTFLPTSGTLQRNGICRLTKNGSLDNGFSIPVGMVYSLDQQSDGKILVGGVSLTRFTPEGEVDLTLNDGTGFNNLIRDLKILPDGKILLGGAFTTYNGSSVNRLIRVENTGIIDSTFDVGSGPAGIVYALELQIDGKVLVGGQFMDFNGTEKLGIVRLNTATPENRTFYDFDGDGKTDVSIFRPSAGEWWYLRSSDGTNRAFQFGASTDKIVPADYTGDGKTDIAFWRESTGEWFVIRSEDNSFYSFPFGTSGDIPAPADFDGDGIADVAIFRPSTATWYIIRSSDSGTTITTFGANGDQPVAADYDGDGFADIAIFRPSDGSWWINRSTAGLLVTNFGTSSDKTVQADYTGDGKTDIAIWRPSTGEWFILRSEDSSFYSVPFGASGDIPAPGDYDGDGAADYAVFRPSNATWYVQQSTAGFAAVSFGAAGDQPVPNAFVR